MNFLSKSYEYRTQRDSRNISMFELCCSTYKTHPKAVETIHAIRASSDTLKEQEATIRKGLNIFKIDQAPNKDIVALDLALEHLEAIWEINR